MAVDFFESQEVARRQTGRLVILFASAVVAMVVLVYGLVVALLGFQGTDPSTGMEMWLPQWWAPQILLAVVVGVGAVVGGGSLYKIGQLRGGGHVVAEQLGGRLLSGDTTEPHERQLLNVVEEMSVASGTPTPPVYLLDDEGGINAFAAGFTPSDAVIGVTRGAMEQFSRDELQGVIAHEFSHILNGDMRLNIRLMGVLHGILIVGILGYFLLRSSLYSGAVRGRSSRDQGAAVWLGLGVGLTVIGFLGSFFGNWIKASVSRQREFLADASAVQFTRNPQGIAGALKRIGGFVEGSRLSSPNTPEASHLFFGQALGRSLFATHPPLEERIRRLDPEFSSVKGVADGEAGPSTKGDVAGFAPGDSRPIDVVEQVGRPTPAHLGYAASLLADLPEVILNAVHEPYGARAVVYGLLLDRDESMRRAQLADLEEHADPGVARLTAELVLPMSDLSPESFLPLVDLLVPALRRLSGDQYALFNANVDRLIRSDDRIDLFEWTLQRLLRTHLRPHFEPTAPARIRFSSLAAVRGPCAVLLSALAAAGSAGDRGFEKGASILGLSGLQRLRGPECGLAAMDRALLDLADVAPRLKREILEAAAQCIADDGQVNLVESELFRATCDSLGCPMPPILPGEVGADS
ncbi:MAG: M48 family metallopeptidase [Myxococcota bacterium]|nr:M48 family metallopeptidase [Myxococcota bacterium]